MIQTDASFYDANRLICTASKSFHPNATPFKNAAKMEEFEVFTLAPRERYLKVRIVTERVCHFSVKDVKKAVQAAAKLIMGEMSGISETSLLFFLFLFLFFLFCFFRCRRAGRFSESFLVSGGGRVDEGPVAGPELRGAAGGSGGDTDGGKDEHHPGGGGRISGVTREKKKREKKKREMRENVKSVL